MQKLSRGGHRLSRMFSLSAAMMLVPRMLVPIVLVPTMLLPSRLLPLTTAAPPLANVFGRPPSTNVGDALDLTEKNGPWMIFAGSFAGSGAEDDAKELVAELRSRYRLPAYLHKKHYDFSKPVRGKGLNPYGGPKIMSYRQKGTYDEIAVLVGDFATVHDPAVDKTLKLLKYAQPKCLTLSNEDPTTLRFAGWRAMQKRLNNAIEKRNKGPLGQAFVSRNPLLPDEFFVPKGIDPLVEKMNKKVKYSLLKCPGKYSVRVATFRGNVVIDQMKIKRIQDSGRMDSRLADAAVKAHRLVTLLREKRIEAYEFHDRSESIVTVGSFNSVGLPRQDGRIEINPAVLQLIQSYGPRKQPVGMGGMAGLVPRSLGGIPFDVQPTAVEVPKRSMADGLAVRGGSVR